MARDDNGSDEDLLRSLAVGKDVDQARLLVLIEERQHQVIKRVIALEKKQEETTKLLNRGIGGAAVMMGLGALIGWLSSSGNALMQWLRGH